MRKIKVSLIKEIKKDHPEDKNFSKKLTDFSKKLKRLEHHPQHFI